MYGLIGKFTAVPGQRDALVAILRDGSGGMPGCLGYVVATDPADADAIWITEVWDTKESHDASLSMPSVKAAIAKGRPLIAAIGPHTVTTPVGGVGLGGGAGGYALSESTAPSASRTAPASSAAAPSRAG